jgi:hypothetical protein
MRGAPLADAAALPEPDRLERIVTIVDTAVAGFGWHHPHLLIAVDGDDLRLRTLDDGAHPADELLGFRAPASWSAIGAVTYGWAAPVDRYGERPSSHPERCRARVTSLVDRGGREAVSTTLDDGRVIDDPGVSVLADVLRRCLGVATAPPPPLRELADVIWLEAVVGAEPPPRSWDEVGALRLPAHARGVTWRRLRHEARAPDAFGRLAAWMDDGMFARWLLGGHPPTAHLLAVADERLPPALARRLRDEVRRGRVTGG